MINHFSSSNYYKNLVSNLIETDYDFGHTAIQGDYTPYPNGSVITAYHGSSTQGIDVFDPSKSSNSDDNFHGKGIFFTTDPVEALGYSLGRPSGERFDETGYVYECKITFNKIIDVGVYTDFDPKIYKEVFGIELDENIFISGNDIFFMAKAAMKQGANVNGSNIHKLFSKAGYTAAIKYACPTDFSARKYHDRIKIMSNNAAKITKSMSSDEAREEYHEEFSRQKEYISSS